MRRTYSLIITFVLGFQLFSSFVFADVDYDLKEMTPQVQLALENRRDRYETLTELKSKGILGENNRGYIEVLIEGEGGEPIAQAENTDRKLIYQTIADQNGLTDAIETIEKVFAQVRRDKAQPGNMIQTEDGNWIAKE